MDQGIIPFITIKWLPLPKKKTHAYVRYRDQRFITLRLFTPNDLFIIEVIRIFSSALNYLLSSYSFCSLIISKSYLGNLPKWSSKTFYHFSHATCWFRLTTFFDSCSVIHTTNYLILILSEGEIKGLCTIIVIQVKS